MKYPKIGQKMIYVGPYADSVPEDAYYGVGTVVRRSTSRETITVQFAEGTFADWPVTQAVTVEHAARFAAAAQKILDEMKEN